MSDDRPNGPDRTDRPTQEPAPDTASLDPTDWLARQFETTSQPVIDTQDDVGRRPDQLPSAPPMTRPELVIPPGAAREYASARDAAGEARRDDPFPPALPVQLTSTDYFGNVGGQLPPVTAAITVIPPVSEVPAPVAAPAAPVPAAPAPAAPVAAAVPVHAATPTPSTPIPAALSTPDPAPVPTPDPAPPAAPEAGPLRRSTFLAEASSVPEQTPSGPSIPDEIPAAFDWGLTPGGRFDPGVGVRPAGSVDGPATSRPQQAEAPALPMTPTPAEAAAPSAPPVSAAPVSAVPVSAATLWASSEPATPALVPEYSAPENSTPGIPAPGNTAPAAAVTPAPAVPVPDSSAPLPSVTPRAASATPPESTAPVSTEPGSTPGPTSSPTPVSGRRSAASAPIAVPASPFSPVIQPAFRSNATPPQGFPSASPQGFPSTPPQGPPGPPTFPGQSTEPTRAELRATRRDPAASDPAAEATAVLPVAPPVPNPPFAAPPLVPARDEVAPRPASASLPSFVPPEQFQVRAAASAQRSGAPQSPAQSPSQPANPVEAPLPWNLTPSTSSAPDSGPPRASAPIPPAVDPVLDGVAAVLPAEPVGLPDPVTESPVREPLSDFDALFGASTEPGAPAIDAAAAQRVDAPGALPSRAANRARARADQAEARHDEPGRSEVEQAQAEQPQLEQAPSGRRGSDRAESRRAATDRVPMARGQKILFAICFGIVLVLAAIVVVLLLNRASAAGALSSIDIVSFADAAAAAVTQAFAPAAPPL